MTAADEDVASLLAAMQDCVERYEHTGNRAFLNRIEADFQKFAQLVTLFLISERDSYYGYFLMAMTFRTNFGVRSIAGIRLDQYPPVFETNPLLLLKFSIREILYIFCHEVDHVVFNHPAEMVASNPGKDPRLFELFNYAADASVNDMLNSEIADGKRFMQAPKGVVTSEVLQEKFDIGRVRPKESYRYYFNLIKGFADGLDEKGESGIAPIPSDDGRSADGNAPDSQVQDALAEGSGDSEPGDSDSASSVITAADVAGSLVDHSWSSSGEPADGEEAAADVSTLDEMAAEAVRELINEVNDMMGREARGLMPGRFTSAVERINRPATLNWKSILKKYVGTIAASKESTRMRLNRRQPRRFDLSGSRESKTLKIAVAIDTSGSVSDEQVKRIFAEILGIIARRKFELTVIECDAKVQRVYRLKTIADLPDHVKGRSGTRFTPVIDYINEHRYFRDALLIYFTDGYGEQSIPRPHTYRNLWVVFEDPECLSVENPYGLVLPLEE